MVADEVTTMDRRALEAADRTFKWLQGSAKPFDGITIVFSGNWRQILTIVPHGSHIKIIGRCCKSSYLWKNWVFKYTLPTWNASSWHNFKGGNGDHATVKLWPTKWTLQWLKIHHSANTATPLSCIICNWCKCWPRSLNSTNHPHTIWQHLSIHLKMGTISSKTLLGHDCKVNRVNLYNALFSAQEISSAMDNSTLLPAELADRTDFAYLL